MRNCFFILAILISIYACEDEVVLDLKSEGPFIVIEGIITDAPGPYEIKISYTKDFYGSNDFVEGSGAEVIISDDAGLSEQLVESTPGIYLSDSLRGIPGHTYRLVVKIDGEEYTAVSTMPSDQIRFDSLTFEYQPSGELIDEGYFAHVWWQDPPGVENYYRLKFFQNDTLYWWSDEGPVDDNVWIWDDRFSDGLTQSYDFFQLLDMGDSVRIEMQHIDNAVYDYYRTLIETRNNAALAPTNPITNLSNDALGYFSAMTIDEITGVAE